MTEMTEEPTRGYWAIRTDRLNRDLIFNELKEGRLRQGWGWDPTQDLARIADKRKAGQALSEVEAAAWSNRRMYDSVREGDRLLLPGLPRSLTSACSWCIQVA